LYYFKDKEKREVPKVGLNRKDRPMVSMLGESIANIHSSSIGVSIRRKRKTATYFKKHNVKLNIMFFKGSVRQTFEFCATAIEKFKDEDDYMSLDNTFFKIHYETVT